MKKGIIKKIVTLLILTAIVSTTIVVPTFAAGGRPYFDITKSGVGTYDYKAIKYIKKHHGFDGVIKGNVFYSRKYITRKEFLKILRNLYGKKYVPITATDRKKYKKTITNKWIFKKLATVADRLGVEYEKDARIKTKAHRADAAAFIMQFCSYSKKLRPKR